MNDFEIRFFFFLIASFSTLFGACVGSFLNVCIYRIPRDESVVTPRSHCPHCNTSIPWYLNIPVFSWLCLRGKCATCKGPISFRYTLVELLTALLFLVVFLKWADPATLAMPFLLHPGMIPVYWLFLSGLVLGTFVDFEHFIIPDSVTIGGMAAGMILSGLVPSMHGTDLWWLGLLRAGVGLATGFGLLLAVAWIGELIFKKGHGVWRCQTHGRNWGLPWLASGAFHLICSFSARQCMRTPDDRLWGRQIAESHSFWPLSRCRCDGLAFLGSGYLSRLYQLDAWLID